MSAGNNRAAYMREYRKRKLLENDSCNNVPKRTKLNAERQREHGETHTNSCIPVQTFSTLILGTKVPATIFHHTVF
jgi:hypothetical protein